jgi:hypothetical protein
LQFERFSQQARVVDEIVLAFEADSPDFDRVVDLMQRVRSLSVAVLLWSIALIAWSVSLSQMQEFGQPPAEIVKAISPQGGDAGADALPGMAGMDPSQCSLM